MRRFSDWLGGALWGIAAYWLWKRWRGEAPTPVAAADADTRAEELRAKLDEVRASDSPSPAEPGEAPESVEERRRRVHDEARGAIDEMHGE
ncbi:MAG TPA: hypothetical protein VFA37_01765 [Gaiellaceae bacterium]|nr:hypothetical protein [Gaiellaceae bacterium]